MGLAAWTDHNLATQGYCLAPQEHRALAVGLRFTAGLCLTLVITGVALHSPALLAGLSVIAAIAGFSPRHSFDHLWNHGARHLLRAPTLPPNPPRRRHAFKLAAAWLLTVAVLFTAGQPTAALILGVMMTAPCNAVTAFNLCLPSLSLSAWEHFKHREAMPA